MLKYYACLALQSMWVAVGPGELSTPYILPVFWNTRLFGRNIRDSLIKIVQEQCPLTTNRGKGFC